MVDLETQFFSYIDSDNNISYFMDNSYDYYTFDTYIETSGEKSDFIIYIFFLIMILGVSIRMYAAFNP